ncbi:MAG TPA: ABC transporter substrate-binding protein [Acetobacteraceae bacterium]|nr:ABC transporter substrate-binding protein [Acetobacteraceae bacterium]
MKRLVLASLLLVSVSAPAAEPPLSTMAEPPLSTAAEPPLRAGVVPAAPPFVVRDKTGQVTGFSVELFRAIAARMKRGVVFTEAALPALQAELAGGEVDVLPGPIAATPERSAAMLFTEGYLWSEDQFGTRAGAHLDALSDLRGKRLAVQDGTEYAEWADRNAARYGFIAATQPTLSAVFDSVRTGLADVSLTDSAALLGAVTRPPHGGPALSGALTLPETRTQLTIAVAEENVDLRDEIEDALVCLKSDGTVARLSASWLGATPGAEDLENLVVPGYGVPGLTGYDPKTRKIHCAT